VIRKRSLARRAQTRSDSQPGAITQPGAARPSAPRRVAGIALIMVSCLMLLGGIVGLASGLTSSDIHGSDFSGVASLFVLGLLAGRWGHSLMNRPPRSSQLDSGYDVVAADDDQLAGEVGDPEPRLPTVNASVRYRELCCGLSAGWRPLAAAVLLAASIALIMAVGVGGNSGGASGLLFLAPVFPGFYLLVFVLSLPYAIVVDGGRLQLGARGVPRVGRLWRKEELPLEVITGWQLVSRREIGPRIDGRELRAGWIATIGSARLLRVTVEPRWHIASPAVLTIVSRPPKFVDTHEYIIGTRRPAAVADALARALPSRACAHKADRHADDPVR
jgi:hypothetical protein